jgi:Arc/MetJ family transcription regulator
MRATIVIDDELLTKAQACTGLSETAAVVHQALKALIEREAAGRLARLGGSQPALASVRRRRRQ